MNKRDLKADLELCNKATPGPWVFNGISVLGAHGLLIARTPNDADAEFIAQAREGWSHAIERAIEAEALVWELVAALRRISEILDNATCRCRCGFCEYFNAQKRADKALAKAKEVLGDGKTPPDYDL